jgi:hypothetical protein
MQARRLNLQALDGQCRAAGFGFSRLFLQTHSLQKVVTVRTETLKENLRVSQHDRL